MTLSVPTDWTHLTPEWLTAALDLPGVVVDTVEVLLRDDGTNRRARLGLTYAADSGVSGPRTVFVKAVDPDHKAMVKLTSGLLHEPRLFNAGVELPLEHPRVYAAVVDEADENFVLVMEDLVARGADPRDSTRPYTVEQVASGVRGLARMHGRFWGAGVARPELGWLEPFVPWDGMQYAPLPAALSALGDDAPASVHALTIASLLEDVWKPYIRTLTVGPQTLLHGDAHIGNTYLAPTGDVGFLDWQVARRGNFSLDLGYFLQGAVTTEDRRTHERELLEVYRGELGLPADELPSADDIWLRYRASVAHGLTLWLVTASAGAWQRRDVSVTLAQRYAAAYEDLQTAQALADLTAAVR